MVNRKACPGITLGAAASLLFILASCGGGGPSGTATTGSIRGTVTGSTGAGMANVAVALSGNAQSARTTSSGVDGVYTFADVLPGNYTLTVTPPTGFNAGMARSSSVTVASGTQTAAASFVLYPGPDPCALARPDFGGPATAADRALFAYDVNAPLNLIRTVDSTKAGVEFSSITYSSPDGGSVTGTLAVPIGRTDPRPGIVLGHPGPGPVAAQFELLELAQRGAIVVMIPAPYIRRGGFGPPTLTTLDRPEQIQMMKDLQRSVDVLLAQTIVDPARIAFAGYSYGGMIGVHFAGIERRLKAAVISAGYGGSVTAATNTNNLQQLSTVSCATRIAWFQENIPVEPIRYVSGASPTALLFQIGMFDTAVLPDDAQAAYNAASSPKEVFYYNTGHGLNAQASLDRYAWLHKQIGIDP
jgi:cephalosporin-C deacetylase-like acetyl esterase